MGYRIHGSGDARTAALDGQIYETAADAAADIDRVLASMYVLGGLVYASREDYDRDNDGSSAICSICEVM